MMRRCTRLLAAPVALTSQQLQDSLTTKLNGWKSEGNMIQKKFEFQDFHQAWTFMSECVPFINEADHHPEWSNCYNRVNVSLTTHDAGNQVSEKDISVAAHMDVVEGKVKGGK